MAVGARGRVSGNGGGEVGGDVVVMVPAITSD